METDAKIIITRPWQIVNSISSYKILINGKHVGAIRNSSVEEYSVEPGLNSVECKMIWCGSKTFSVNLQAGETIYLKVKNGMKFYLVLVLLMGAGLFIKYFYDNYPDKPLWVVPLNKGLIIVVLVYTLYYFTVGRKNYLILEKDTENIFAKQIWKNDL